MSQPQQAQSNGLGVAGFVTSLVGLVACCGLLCPLGALFSFIAMFKRPRGLAIAGFIIGIVGSMWLIVPLVFVILPLGFAVVVGSFAALGSGGFEYAMDLSKIHRQVTAHYNANNQLPSTLGLLPLDAETLIDPWGAQYRYEIDPDGRHYTITTAGPDGAWDTGDEYSTTKDAATPY